MSQDEVAGIEMPRYELRTEAWALQIDYVDEVALEPDEEDKGEMLVEFVEEGYAPIRLTRKEFARLQPAPGKFLGYHGGERFCLSSEEFTRKFVPETRNIDVANLGDATKTVGTD